MDRHDNKRDDERQVHAGADTRQRRKGIYILPSLFTTASLFAAFYAIVQAMQGNFEHAPIAIFVSMVLDALDGRVARLTHTESEFGTQYDSIVDMVAFGLAPALVMYVWALSGLDKLGWLAAFVYAACAALRLARFNVQVGSVDKRYFRGLPSPAAAAVVAGFIWVMYSFGVPGREISLVALFITVVAGGLMVSNVRYRSFKDLDLRGRVPFVAILAVPLVFVLIVRAVCRLWSDRLVDAAAPIRRARDRQAARVSAEITLNDHLIIFDTTLRDGEQSPGASMTRDEKVRIAKLLERMRVDIIEAGFPVASNGDFESVRAVAEAVTESTVCALARATQQDIDRAAEAIRPAKRGRIHTFIATSPIHMQNKLRMTPDAVLERAVWAVKHARQYTDDVEFSPEDAGRSEVDFLCRVLEAVIAAGARTVNIPDTVGYNLPHQFGGLIKTLRERVPNSGQAVFSVHCHNDLGLAVANSLSAVLNGARQVECTINGLGERAGNASLEEVVMAVRTRRDIFPCDTRIDATHIVPASRLVSNITGFPVQPNKAVVGANAFAHESGIHQDGVIKMRETYEIMRAEDVGWSANRMVLGKHSGRNAFRQRLAELRIEFKTEHELNAAFDRFKDLADKKHEIFDEDLQALVTEADLAQANEHLRLVSLKVCSQTGGTPVAEVRLAVDGAERQASAAGSGPVDASFKAIDGIVGTSGQLLLYSVNNITSGTDSQGEVTVRLEKGGRIVNGHGADTDIVIASAKAYLNALNKLITPGERVHPQGSTAI